MLFFTMFVLYLREHTEKDIQFLQKLVKTSRAFLAHTVLLRQDFDVEWGKIYLPLSVSKLNKPQQNK